MFIDADIMDIMDNLDRWDKCTAPAVQYIDNPQNGVGHFLKKNLCLRCNTLTAPRMVWDTF